MLDKNIRTLIDTFRDQYASYRSPQYNETQLRREFLDKFIKALGWDVDNEQCFSETFKEVIHEASQQVGNEKSGKENHTKRPDYGIQIGGRKLFYIEAKKPSIDIRENSEPAYQVRRYGWNAKMPVCLLTNFEEFAVYDTTSKPLENDTAATARIFYCRYDELEKHNPKYPSYECNWDFLYALFSKDVVQKDSLEKYRKTDKKKGTQEVDQVFLNEIEDWRVQLALNVTLRNAELNERDLNDVVQKTIDRIIFLRIAEDRGIERENTLQKIADGKDVYQNLVTLFKTADDKYNSGLFHFRNEKGNTDKPDILTPKIIVDDKVLKSIIKSLYYPNPYEFSVMPSDILGSVYERFLGKVIRLTAGHRAKVEEKPEVRKAGGVYYTPSYIVDYIVKNTIGETLTNKTPKSLGNFRIVDPACGSGSFLVGAYQFLLDWYLHEYVKSPSSISSNKKRLLKVSGGNYKLTIQERKRILTTHIFGVDIDTQAVEVAKLSLLLKALEGLSEQEIQLSLFNERALPNLSSNIKCGNSLIGNDFYSQGTLNLTEDEQYKINAFDWQDEFKDACKDGGFDVVIGNPPYGGELTEDEITYLNNNTNDKTHDTYILFIIQALEHLLKYDGIFSFIVPRFIQFNRNMETIRRQLLSGLTSLAEVGMCFKQANTECLIFVYKNSSNVKFAKSLFYYPNEEPIFNRKISHNFIKKFPNCIYNVYVSDKEFAVIEKMAKNERTLAGTNPTGKMIRGMEGYKANITTKKTGCKTIIGGELSEYIQDETFNCFVNVKYKEVCRLSSIIGKDKVLIRRVANKLIANVDYGKNAFTKNLYAFYDSIYDLKFVLGLLNSRLLTFFLKKLFTMRKEEIFPEIVSYQLEQLPIPNLDLSKKSDKSTHDKLVTMVNNMLELKRREKNEQNPHTKTMIARQITALDKDIDKFVYALYDLTEEEINVVEEKR